MVILITIIRLCVQQEWFGLEFYEMQILQETGSKYILVSQLHQKDITTFM